jgi:hypothetical protein
MSENRIFDITADNSKKAFSAALAQCRKGDKIIYSRGRALCGPHATAAFAASEAGNVSLVQKRMPQEGPISKFEYIAVRNSHRLKVR